MSRPADTLARGMRDYVERVARDAAGNIQLGEIVSVDPLKIELMERGTTLHDDELLVADGQGRWYGGSAQWEEEDVAVLMRKHIGGEIHWIVLDVLSDRDPIPEHTAGDGIAIDADREIALAANTAALDPATNGWTENRPIHVHKSGMTVALEGELLAALTFANQGANSLLINLPASFRPTAIRWCAVHGNEPGGAVVNGLLRVHTNGDVACWGGFTSGGLNTRVLLEGAVFLR